jgi:glycosyltransferase involved in cell wall biosynthesis
VKIFIDARYIQSSYSGIATYSELLLKGMGRQDTRNNYTVLVHSSYRGDLDLPDNFEVLEADARPVSFHTVFRLQKLVRKYDPDIYHSLMPLWPLALRNQVRTVATVFDLQPLLDPHFTSGRPAMMRKAYDIFYGVFYRRCFMMADYLIAISHATRRDISQLVPRAAEHTLVIQPGFEPEITTPPTDEQMTMVREKYDLPERFILYLGSTRPNKNLTRMLDAYQELLKRHPEEKNLRWVMVLKPDRFFDPFFAAVRNKGLLRQIQIFDQVSELEKRVFYRSASLLYFPTLFEGFGLPVLEAQGNGLPVLASTHSALPEVAGKGAVLVDGLDVTSIADGLEVALYDEQARAELVALGHENVKRFSWDSAAREVLNMYEHLLK